MSKKMRFGCSAVLLLALSAACGGGDTTSGLPPAAGGAGDTGATYDPATATATVSGKMMFEGTPPEPERIQMAADPFCASNSQNAMTEEVVVSDGGLENVMVYVSSGTEGMSFPTPSEPVLLDQKGCRYEPHVFTIQVNQPLTIRNSDSTLHNIHAWAETNMPFNIGQPVQNMETTQTFMQEEVPLPIRCDVHRWMNAQVGVFDHPFHTVSRQGGTFELRLPPGSYEIVAWHEKYGAQTQTVEVADNETVDLNFTFSEATSTD